VSFENRKVLVTGGAGFVGSNIVKALVESGAIVTALDDLFTGDPALLPDSRSLTFVKGSVCDAEQVQKLVSDAELIVHAAARNIIASTKDPRQDFETNIGGTLNVLLAARSAKIERIVYTSSASVYGNPRYMPINEDDSLWPLSPYAVSKLAGENYCIAFYESYGVPTTVLRYSNVYGPHQDPRNAYCGVVAKFIDAARSHRPPQIHGDGESTRDYTYVDDAVAMTLAALGTPRSEGQVLNVGTGTETSVNALCSIILTACGSQAAPEYVPRRDIDNIRRRVLNVEKARRILHWQPTVTLPEGIRRTVRWIAETQGR